MLCDYVFQVCCERMFTLSETLLMKPTWQMDTVSEIPSTLRVAQAFECGTSNEVPGGSTKL